MVTLALVSLTCWACAVVAHPRKPLLGHEVEELVYARLLGRQQRLILLALLVTGVLALVFAVTRPNVADADLQGGRAQRACTQPSVGFPTCYEKQANGTWVQEELQSDGTWLAVSTVTATEGLVP